MSNSPKPENVVDIETRRRIERRRSFEDLADLVARGLLTRLAEEAPEGDLDDLSRILDEVKQEEEAKK